MTRHSGDLMDSILLTGGAGYIGSHAAKCLSQQGFLPIVYDDLSRGHREAVKWGPLEIGGLADTDRLNEVFAKYAPKAVMHFAAFAYVGESTTQPALYYRNNVSGTLSLLEAMQVAKVDKLVFSSTCAVYGIPDAIPVVEENPRRPINPYGRSKNMIEQILEDYAVAYPLRSVCLRYFNAAGADADGEIGEVHDPEPHLLPLILDAAAGKIKHVTIFGNDYATPDGTCIRDYIHVTDLAEAHVLAVRHLLSADRGSAHQRSSGESLCLNLGNETGYSVREVIDTAARITGKPIAFRMEPRRPGDPPILIGNAAKAKAILNWKPKHSSLESILSSAWAWHQRKSTW
jgi:UDP-glucose-4-epimerase GalE